MSQDELMSILDNEKYTSIKELSDRLKVRCSSINRMISQLQKYGFIEVKIVKHGKKLIRMR